MTADPTRHERNDERDEAQDDKKKADPKVDDPAFMPNITPQTGKPDDEERADGH